jgi:aryl-alcohol dehydrogenase-like predicted oxidoreductase
MKNDTSKSCKGISRRDFIGNVGKGAAISAFATTGLGSFQSVFASTGGEMVAKRRLGKTELMISEIGIGAHTFSNWIQSCTEQQAIEILASARDIGVNHIDANNPELEHTIPPKAMKALNCRNDFILSVRDVRLVQGNKGDIERIYSKVDQRLQQWGTDHFDLLFMGSVYNEFMDLSWAIEALTKVKEQGKARFTGFGCHFSRENFKKAIDMYGDAYDVTSIPYNVFHRAAEEVFPAMKEKDLGVIVIKPFAAGSLLKSKDLTGVDKGLPRDMLSFVLANEHVHSVLPGLGSVEQGQENFSASWNPISVEKVAMFKEEYPSKPEVPGSADYPKGRSTGGAPSGPPAGFTAPSASFDTTDFYNDHIDWLKDWEC